MEKIKYITNKELLLEIHRSKITYCFYERDIYQKFHIIVNDMNKITQELKDQVLHKINAKAEVKLTEDDLVYRLMTDEHIPRDFTGKLRKSSLHACGTTSAIRTVFPPFKHFIKVDGEYREVARSHWVGSISNGEFCGDHGMISNRLALMFMLLVERYSKRGNWRGYTYNDEMRGNALLQLSQIGLQFDESKSDNPFAFYTQVIKNCFRRVLNVEKKNQDIRDDLLIVAGAVPSFTRQVENEMEQQQPPQEVKVPKKRGRKAKV